MRIATFNVENLFDRAKALNQDTWAEGRTILDRHARVNRLLGEARYTPARKRAILELLGQLGVAESDEGGPFARLRQVRGRLLRRPRSGPPEVVAEGRADWIGWVELKTEPVDELAMEHTAMVIRDVAPDVLGVVEAENRIALDTFSALLLERVGATPFPHVMVIDGNDERGIDVGLMARTPIGPIRSHVDDADADGEIFSRDCTEYELATPAGERLVAMVNHFKSKGYGGARASAERRRRQAVRVADLYDARRAAGDDLVVVVGDLNDTPDSEPLAPLLGGTDLQDIAEHPRFVSDGRPGTYGNGTKGSKLDYVLLSPALFDRVTGGGVFRKGVWGGEHGTLWEIYPTMTAAVHAASDHAALFADIDV